MSIDSYTGRTISKSIIFGKKEETPLDNLYAAKDYLWRNGYTCGRMCGSLPIGIAESAKTSDIAKWRNIGRDEYWKLGGIIVLTNENRQQYTATILFFE